MSAEYSLSDVLAVVQASIDRCDCRPGVDSCTRCDRSRKARGFILERIEADESDVVRLGAPAWPGQREGKAPPEGWVQLSVNNLSTHTAPPASPAGVPDSKVIVTGFLPKSRVVELRFDSALPAWICEPGVHVTVTASPSATPEGGEVQP